MVGPLSFSSISNTKKEFLDNARPPEMLQADQAYKTLAFSIGTSSNSAFLVIQSLSELFLDTKFHQIDDRFIKKVETAINQGKSLGIKAKNGIDQYKTALSLLYNALNTLDSNNDPQAVSAFRDIYVKMSNHVRSGITGHQNENDKTSLDRILNTIDTRMDKIIKRMNKDIDNGRLQGSKISVF